jgi:hypothetical protein
MIDSEFYVGYVPQAPHRLAEAVRRFALGLVALSGIIAAVLVFAQSSFPASTFEFQNYKQFEGVLRERPYPGLLAPSEYLLVAPGKHGAADLVRGLDGRTVRLKGSLIYRDGVSMIEVLPSTIEPTGRAPAPDTATVELGNVTLAGEIVDSKCYLGVMNPGAGKVHRDCAARCISGGAPPALIAKDASGAVKMILLSGSHGLTLNRRVLDFVAERVDVSGRLMRSCGMLVIETDPTSIRRRQ